MTHRRKSVKSRPVSAQSPSRYGWIGKTSRLGVFFICLGVLAIVGTVYAVHDDGSDHLPRTVTDAAGQTRTYTYDEKHRLQSVESPPRMGLQPGEASARQLTPAERTTTYEYYPDDAPTGAGRLKKVTGPATPQGSPAETYEYDEMGRVRKYTDADGYVLAYEYDALDRVVKATYPDGTYEETAYNRLDPERTRDRLGRWSHEFHDALRNSVAARDPLGRAVTFQWCSSCGSLDGLVDAAGRPTRWERDLEGRVVKAVRPDQSATESKYENTTGRLKETKDAKGQRTVYEYELDDSIRSITYADATVPTPGATFTYDPVSGRMLTMTDGSGTTTYTYHPITNPPTLGAGKLASVDGPLPDDTVTYSYDEIGRVVRRSINEATWTRAFDSLGRVASMTTPAGAFRYGYDGVSDRVASVAYPNGQSATYIYYANNGDRRLTEIHHLAQGGATLSSFAYTYDAAGNIKTWTRQFGTDPASVYAYQYDAADQLIAATLTSGGATPTTLKRYRFAYDPAGNRIGEQIDDVAIGATFDNRNRLVSQQPGGAMLFAGTVNEPASVTVQGKPAQVGADNRFEGSAAVGSEAAVTITATDPSGNTRSQTYRVTQAGSGTSFAYDANGNLTSDGTRTFAWDAANRLVAIVDGTRRSEFRYDGRGRRVRITEKDGGAVISDRRLVWCAEELCEERDGDGVAVLRRFAPDGFEEGTNSFFFTRDHIFSVRELTDTSGTLRARYDYDPYGRVTRLVGDLDSPFAYTGHPYHPPSKLHLTLYRAYDAQTAQWLSEDPVDFQNGLSRYAYVLSNPVRYYDSVGLAAQPAPTCSKDCPPGMQDHVNDACRFGANHKDAYVRECMRKKCRDKKFTVRCGTTDSPPCKGRGPGFTDKSAGFITLCPNEPMPKNGCWRRVILHEMVDHVCRPGGPAIPDDEEHEWSRQLNRDRVPCPTS